MTEVKFTHGIYKTDCYLYAEQVYGFVTMPNNQVTALVAVGGAAMPVTDTIDEAKAKIAAALASTNKSMEDINGTTSNK